MSEPFLDLLHWHALCEEHRGAGVAKIVEAELLQVGILSKVLLLWLNTPLTFGKSTNTPLRHFGSYVGYSLADHVSDNVLSLMQLLDVTAWDIHVKVILKLAWKNTRFPRSAYRRSS